MNQYRFMTLCACLVLGVLVGVPCAFAQNPSGYHLGQKIQVGGEGGWDYLNADAASHRLYVSHGMSVVVISLDSLKVIGEIPKTEGVHGIAIANDLGRGYISNGRASNVTVFDLKTLEVLRRDSSGTNPDAILYDPFSHRVFVYNGRSNDATVIDAKTDAVVATIPLGGKPEFSQTDGKGRVFVNIEDKSEVVAIDATTLKILARWPITPGEEPSGLAIDVEHHRLFAVCGNKLMVVLDSDNGSVVASLPIGDRTDGCAFDPGTGLAFSSNGEGTMTVVREESPMKFSVVENVPTQAGARTIAVDPTTHAVYLPTALFGPAPAPTAERPRPRPTILPNSFVVLQFKR